MESSPACSEYSSPPHSPIPEQVKCQVESPLMDEVDRGNVLTLCILYLSDKMCCVEKKM